MAHPYYAEAWEQWFSENPEVLAAWGHQNGYPPPGYTDPRSADFDPEYDPIPDDDDEEYEHG